MLSIIHCTSFDKSNVLPSYHIPWRCSVYSSCAVILRLRFVNAKCTGQVSTPGWPIQNIQPNKRHHSRCYKAKFFYLVYQKTR